MEVLFVVHGGVVEYFAASCFLLPVCVQFIFSLVCNKKNVTLYLVHRNKRIIYYEANVPRLWDKLYENFPCVKNYSSKSSERERWCVSSQCFVYVPIWASPPLEYPKSKSVVKFSCFSNQIRLIINVMIIPYYKFAVPSSSLST